MQERWKSWICVNNEFLEQWETVGSRNFSRLAFSLHGLYALPTFLARFFAPLNMVMVATWTPYLLTNRALGSLKVLIQLFGILLAVIIHPLATTTPNFVGSANRHISFDMYYNAYLIQLLAQFIVALYQVRANKLLTEVPPRKWPRWVRRLIPFTWPLIAIVINLFYFKFTTLFDYLVTRITTIFAPVVLLI